MTEPRAARGQRGGRGYTRTPGGPGPPATRPAASRPCPRREVCREDDRQGQEPRGSRPGQRSTPCASSPGWTACSTTTPTRWWSSRTRPTGSASDAHIADVTLVVDGRTLRSRAAGGTYQEALDTVVDRVERQAIDHKEKPRVRARPEEEKAILRKIADGTAEPGGERQIVKTKRFAIEPMFEEDAVAAMEDLGHDFYVFVNAETERIGVLYRRRDGNFGLIEPVTGGEYTSDRRAGAKSGRSSSPQRLRDATVEAGLPGDVPVVDEIAAQRGDVGVEQREPLVDLLLRVLAVLGEDPLEQEPEHDLPLAVLGGDRLEAAVDQVRPEDPGVVVGRVHALERSPRTTRRRAATRRPRPRTRTPAPRRPRAQPEHAPAPLPGRTGPGGCRGDPPCARRGPPRSARRPGARPSGPAGAAPSPGPRSRPGGRRRARRSAAGSCRRVPAGRPAGQDPCPRV